MTVFQKMFRITTLGYRDKHGRLLTQKEACRDLCYQFHGHGAPKRGEEERLKQIAREQADVEFSTEKASRKDSTGLISY